MCNSRQQTIDEGRSAAPKQQLSAKERDQLFSRLRQSQRPKHTIPSGYNELDKQLGGGWPQGCLIELLGHNALQPILPLLIALCRKQKNIVWISPPHTPYLPALVRSGLPASQQVFLQPKKPAEHLWCMEQVLRTATCGAALCWQEPTTAHSLRRLQLAAEAGTSVALLFRPISAINTSSIAAVRLILEYKNQQLYGNLLKARGGFPGEAVALHPLSSEETPHGS